MKLTQSLIVALGLSVIACSSDPGVIESSDPAGRSGDDPKTRDGGRGRDGGRASQSGSPDDDACDSLNISARPNSPDILIVLDRSGSMIGAGASGRARLRWEPSVRAVRQVTMRLSGTVAFGLMTFPAPNSLDTCAPGRLDVPITRDSAERIAGVLAASGPLARNQTPTAQTLEAAYAQLVETCADCASTPKYVLLVTDGQPTCGSSRSAETTPEDIARTVAAIDKLSEAGIPTYVVGYDTASDPTIAATMDRFAEHGGTERHIPVENEQTLVTELTRISATLVSCEYALQDEIDDPEFVRVTIDGKQLDRGDWRVRGKTIVLEGACDVLRDGKVHQLTIVKECERVNVI